MEQKNISKFISTLRKSKGMTQQELGDLLGVSSKTISKWECGNGLPDISFLKKISSILGVTVEELLDGKIQNNQKVQTKERSIKKIVILFLILIISILIISIMIILNKEKHIEQEECTIIRTYYIDNIGKSQDENYLYITIHEFQVEGTYTLKLPKLVSQDLKVGNSYEFTFKTNKNYLNTTTDILFNNSEIINLKYSDKVGLDRVSTSSCNKVGGKNENK